MIYINIITPFNHEVFMRQLPSSFENEGFLFFENSFEDHIWDMVIVYEGINNNRTIKYKQDGLIFISGEPPFSMTYSRGFLNQFNHLISAHSNFKHKNNHLMQQGLPWHIGISHQSKKANYNYIDLVNMPFPDKNKNISIITSNKKMMPGHRQRMKFLAALKDKFGDKIDYFGHGINPIDDKATALLNYKFNICIENSAIDNYWTEKIADPFLGYCIPIYHGCKNINSYFDNNSYIKIDVNNIKESLEVIENVLLNVDELYKMKVESLTASRDKVLNEYNLFSMLAVIYNKKINNYNGKQVVFDLKSVHYFKDQKINMYILRANRFLKRYI